MLCDESACHDTLVRLEVSCISGIRYFQSRASRAASRQGLDKSSASPALVNGALFPQSGIQGCRQAGVGQKLGQAILHDVPQHVGRSDMSKDLLSLLF